MPSEAALSRPARLENLTLWQRVYDHLREEILARCSEYLPAIRAVCRKWAHVPLADKTICVETLAVRRMALAGESRARSIAKAAAARVILHRDTDGRIPGVCRAGSRALQGRCS